ncbi:hypothetical protein AAXE64_08330 [Priestia megaterium]
MRKSYEIAELFLKGKKELTLSPKQFKWLTDVIVTESPSNYHNKSISYDCHNPKNDMIYKVMRVTRTLTAMTVQELREQNRKHYSM